MVGTARTLLLMLIAPPLLLLFWAHVVRPGYSGWDWVAIIAAAVIGLIGAVTAPWHGRREWIAVVYALLLVPVLPFAGLLAVCSTGDCL